MECLVEYDYNAEELDELTLKKGDRITGVVTMNDGWWEGTLNGKRGLFPDNFVRVITANSGSTATSISSDVPKSGEGETPKMRQKSGPGPHARKLKAIFSYAPLQDDELRLDVGDMIQFLDEIEEGWFKGELKGRVGVFPSNFVEEVDKDNAQNGTVVKAEKGIARNRDTFIAKNKVIPDIIPTQNKDEEESAPKLPPKPVRETARCFYPYFASNDDELTMQEGDIVTIISKDCEDEGWWRGELKGKIGVFPDNFVEIIIPNSPTTNIPAVNQSKVTAQERTDDSKKEGRYRPGSLQLGTSIVDGIGTSKTTTIKTESKVASQIKAFAKKESPTNKGPAPMSPVSPLATTFGGASMRKDTKPAIVPSETESTDELNLNSIERSEKLNHLTVTRAKAPKRRPPSGVITREDEQEYGLTNGTSGTVSLPMQSDRDHVPQPQVAPPPIARSNSHTIHVPDGTVATPAKEPSPGPQSIPTHAASGVNKPKAAIPWMAELKLKQDKKSTALVSPTAPTVSSASVNNNNVSTVIVAPPAAANIISTAVPAAQTHTKAPPLPVKPNIPAPSPALTSQQIEKTQTTTTSVTNQISAPISNRFGASLKRNSSNPTPPTNPVGQPGTVEYVTLEEYNQLKERVISLENELDSLKRQLKGLAPDGDSRGLIV